MVNVNQKVINKKTTFVQHKEKKIIGLLNHLRDYFRLKFRIAGENLNLIGGN